jgi:GTP cyclohydrolase I
MEKKLEEAIRTILIEVGEDPTRKGLSMTPGRVARALREMTAGYKIDVSKLIEGALFESDYDEMVLVRDIEFASLCEHHLLPFIGFVHVAYIPNGRIIGLSKIPRIVDAFAKRLQVQERMTVEIADFLENNLDPLGVAVVIEALHTCSMIRGVKKSQARMATSAMRGVFREDPRTRAEFLSHLERKPFPLI